MLKTIAQGAVATVAPVLWRWRKSSLLVLMYHRVLPADHPDRLTEQPGMYVSPQTLAMHVAVLKRKFVVVHLDEWLDDVTHGRQVPRRACAITFDDGWRDNYQYAFPILQQAQVPAAIFLVSDLVGKHYSFWPNALARILAGDAAHRLASLPDWLLELVQSQNAGRDPHRVAGPLDATQIDAIISTCKQVCSDADMLRLVQQWADRFAAPGQAQRDLMSWDEIREMQSSGLVRFGSHTRRHTRLTGIVSAAAMQDEIAGSRHEIEQHLGTAPRLFCYPNGDTSPQGIAAVRSAYEGAVTTQRGWHSPQRDRFLIPRIGVHEDVSDRRAAFLARLSGWL